MITFDLLIAYTHAGTYILAVKKIGLWLRLHNRMKRNNTVFECLNLFLFYPCRGEFFSVFLVN